MAGELHEIAVTAEGSLEQLATGLGEAGAPPETVQAVTQMADVMREIVKALGAEDVPPEAEGLPPEAGDPAGTPEPAGPATIGEAVDQMGA